MKKIITLCAVAGLSFATALAGNSNYKVDDASIDQLFAQSEDISMTASTDFALQNTNLAANLSSVNGGGEKTVGGFLIRAWFCGFIALHRSYMGTGGKTLWYYYFCIPVMGGVTSCVDFWWVVFKGKDALNKYKDNSKFIVWAN
jgi:hypothetical protein